MNRLCIYMTYNRENKIHDYIGQVIRSLKQCSSTLCLVCNYEKIKEGKEHIAGLVDEIYYRENKGYDSGAFRDALCDFLGWERVYEYDELILANDSFFGFFYPLQESFLRMEGQECDFWGMTGQTAGEFSDPFYAFDAHVHSYFLVFKQPVIKSHVFRKFWEEFTYPGNFREAVVNFEISINKRLKQHGFQGKSYIDIYDIRLQRNENPYYSRPYELVRKYGLPVMKKKSVLIRNPGFSDTLKTISYLQRENLYPVQRILSFLEHQFCISGSNLEVFYRKHSMIYIYGAGVCGKNIALYFAFKNWKYKGFIVTRAQDITDSVFTIQQVQMSPDTGIIISVLSRKMADEITAHIGDRCRREQLFFISDCSAVRLPD